MLTVDGLVLSDGSGREVAMPNAEAMGAEVVGQGLAAQAAAEAYAKNVAL